MNKLNNEKQEIHPVIRKSQEYSFTLLEVIIAVGLLTVVVMNVAGGQGSLFEITDYSKKSTEATWLAKRIMSEVEYQYAQYDLKDLEQNIKDQAFEGIKDPDTDYKFAVDIVEWKLPLIDFLTGGGGKSEEEKEEDKDNGKPESAVAGIPGLDAIINQIFDGHMMKTAHVEVSWAEGARRNSVALTYLLTNQKKLDDYVLTKTKTWDDIRKKMDPNAKGTAANTGTGPGGTPAPGTPGTPGVPGTPNSGSGTNPGGLNPGGTPAPTVPEVQVP